MYLADLCVCIGGEDSRSLEGKNLLEKEFSYIVLLSYCLFSIDNFLCAYFRSNYFIVHIVLLEIIPHIILYFARYIGFSK